MKALFWIIIGALLTMSGQAVAQYFEGHSTDGTHLHGYTDQGSGMTFWNDSRGQSGSMYAPVPAVPIVPRNPC